jgi:hypothetical protein
MCIMVLLAVLSVIAIPFNVENIGGQLSNTARQSIMTVSGRVIISPLIDLIDLSTSKAQSQVCQLI